MNQMDEQRRRRAAELFRELADVLDPDQDQEPAQDGAANRPPAPRRRRSARPSMPEKPASDIENLASKGATTVRERGTGTKELLPSGKVRVRVHRDGRRVNRVVATEKEADRLLLAWHTAAAVGEVSSSAPTLAEWGTRWLLERTCRSADSERLRWQSLVLPAPLAQRRVDENPPGPLDRVRRVVEPPQGAPSPGWPARRD